jgi:regulator of replication initiation timing
VVVYVDERKKRIEEMLREIAETELELMKLKLRLAEFAEHVERSQKESR